MYSVKRLVRELDKRFMMEMKMIKNMMIMLVLTQNMIGMDEYD